MNLKKACRAPFLVVSSSTILAILTSIASFSNGCQALAKSGKLLGFSKNFGSSGDKRN